MTGKLHELLAVEGDLSATASRLIEEACETLSRKSEHFMGSTTRTEMLDEARQGENRDDYHEMVTTVADKLVYLVTPVSKHVDAVLQKDCTNQEARADLEIDGKVVAEGLPATFLLSMESFLRRVRQVYESIPTLKPGMRWEKNTDLGQHVYQAPEQVTFRTEKHPVHKIVVEPTEHHPAQIDKWTEDRNIARIIKTETSGMLSPLDKSLILGRIDTLQQAVKKARMRANGVEVVKRNIGETLFAYIHGSEV